MALSKIDVANMLTGLVPNDNTIRRPNAKPIIINGDMAVAQRGTSTTGVTNGNSGYITCDRMLFNESGTMGAALTITQESLTSGNAFLNGFANAYKVDVTTADGSPDADDWSRLNMRLESQDLQVFKKGTANAEKFTLAFWVKATKTGTNTIELYDGDNTRCIGGSYSISSSNTWEHKVVNFAADTTGAFADDNGEGLRISWTLSAGSNYSSGTLPTAWGSCTSANTAEGQVNHFDSTSNNFHITGIQLEVGEFNSSTLPPFQHESFGNNLARCQRYYNIFGNNTGKPMGMAAFYSASAAYVGPLVYPVEMRSTPTITITGGSGDAEATAGYALNHSASNDWFQTFSSSTTSTKECQVYVSSGVSAADGDAGRCKIGDSEDNKGKIEASAEL